MSGTHEAGHSAGVRARRDVRRTRVAEMLVSHVTVREMAQRLGVSKSAVDRDVQVIRRYWRTQMVRGYGALVADEVLKLDELERVFMPRAQAGDHSAASQVLRIMDHRALSYRSSRALERVPRRSTPNARILRKSKI